MTTTDPFPHDAVRLNRPGGPPAANRSGRDTAASGRGPEDSAGPTADPATRKSRGIAGCWRAGAPTTLAGVEFVLAVTFIGYRLLNIGQSLMAVGEGVSHATRPWLDIVSLTVFIVAGGCIGVAILRRRAYRDRRWGLLDVGLGTAVLLATSYFTQQSDRFTSWADWGYPVSLSVAFGAGVVFRRWWAVFGVAVLLALCYLSTTMPNQLPPADRTTALTNSLAYLMMSAIAWLLSSYLRRLGAAADDARATAARLGAQLERDRHRQLLHDHATILEVFARSDPDNPLVAIARSRAASGSAQIRAFLRGDAGPRGSLAAALAHLADEFPALDITVNVGLATAALPAPATAAVVGAVRTLLDNVHWHAGAVGVVLHSSTVGGRWEVTVTDDGVGFEPQSRPPGYGLATQVTAAVAAIGGTTTVTSAPGSGTTVTLEGPLPRADPAAAQPGGRHSPAR